MGIGPMTFSLRERRSATELNRPAYQTTDMLCFYVILPLLYVRKVPWCRGSIQDFGSWDPSSILGGTTFLSFYLILSKKLFIFKIIFLKATMGIGPMTFSLRERRSATELNRLPFLSFFVSLSPLSFSYLLYL